MVQHGVLCVHVLIFALAVEYTRYFAVGIIEANPLAEINLIVVMYTSRLIFSIL